MSVNRIWLAASGALLCLAVAAFGFTSAESERMKKAKALYDANNFDGALSLYEEVLRSNPGSAVAGFNVGLALYRKKEFIKAVENFQTALATEDRGLEKKALLFIGNSYFNLAEEAERIDETLAARSFREAMGYYRRAMELDYEDRDLNYNYELAKKRLYYIAEGAGGSGKDMMRMSVGALMQEDREFALARQRDLGWREEDEKTARDRRAEDRRRRDARREEDRATDRKRRMEDEDEAAELTAPTVSGDEEAKGVRPLKRGQTPFAREAARRAEDAVREKAREAEDAELEARRLREDAEREEKRAAERGAANSGRGQV